MFSTTYIFQARYSVFIMLDVMEEELWQDDLTSRLEYWGECSWICAWELEGSSGISSSFQF